MGSITQKIRQNYFTSYTELMKLCDEVDEEHYRRMKQQARDIRKASCRYFASVIEDYKHGKKRERPTYAIMTGKNEKDFPHCSWCGETVLRGYEYCPHCGRGFVNV